MSCCRTRAPSTSSSLAGSSQTSPLPARYPLGASSWTGRAARSSPGSGITTSTSCSGHWSRSAHPSDRRHRPAHAASLMGEAPVIGRPPRRRRLPRRVLGRCADARAARRGHGRDPGLPHQRRRAQRVAQLGGLPARRLRRPTRRASSAKSPRSRSRDGSTSSIPSVGDRLVQQMATDAASRGVVGLVDLDMAWNEEAWARRTQGGFDTLRVEFGIYPEHLAAGARRRAPDGRRRAGSGIRSRPCRTVQGDHRRVARHPDSRLLARLSGRPAQPRAAHGRAVGARRAHDTGDGRRARVRDPCHRRRRQHPRARRLRHDGRDGDDRARAAGRARRYPAIRSPRRDRECSARARRRRPRPHRHDLGGPDGAALSARSARRDGSQPRSRLGRTGLAARPVGGAGGSGVPHPRRPRAVASRPGSRYVDGARRLDAPRLVELGRHRSRCPRGPRALRERSVCGRPGGAAVDARRGDAARRAR